MALPIQENGMNLPAGIESGGLRGLESVVIVDTKDARRCSDVEEQQPSKAPRKVPELDPEACVFFAFTGELKYLVLPKLETELNHLLSLSTEDYEVVDYVTIVNAVCSKEITFAGTGSRAAPMFVTTTATVQFADSREAEDILHCGMLPDLELSPEFFPYLHRVHAVQMSVCPGA